MRHYSLHQARWVAFEAGSLVHWWAEDDPFLLPLTVRFHWWYMVNGWGQA